MTKCWGEGRVAITGSIYQYPIQGGTEILLVASCYRNWDKFKLKRLLMGLSTDCVIKVTFYSIPM